MKIRFELKHLLKALTLSCDAVEKCKHSYDNVKQVWGMFTIFETIIINTLCAI